MIKQHTGKVEHILSEYRVNMGNLVSVFVRSCLHEDFGHYYYLRFVSTEYPVSRPLLL